MAEPAIRDFHAHIYFDADELPHGFDLRSPG